MTTPPHSAGRRESSASAAPPLPPPPLPPAPPPLPGPAPMGVPTSGPTAEAVSGTGQPVLKRPAAMRFVADTGTEGTAPLIKESLLHRGSARPVIGRERKVSGNLPDWDLLPPAEIVVPDTSSR